MNNDTLKKYYSLLTVIIISLIYAGSANAHDISSLAGGFGSGFMHPVLGWDHVSAMVAVGLWGAFLGYPAIWVLPVVFPLVMAMGGALGVVIGVPYPAIETGIALSAITLGSMVCFAVRPPVWVAAVVVGLFAIFHGYAHGVELPRAANPLTYSAGFVLATGMLHVCGIVIGLLTRWPAGKVVVRTGGAMIAIAGIGFLTGVV